MTVESVVRSYELLDLFNDSYVWTYSLEVTPSNLKVGRHAE
jgi:hypothetical protein